MKIRNLLCVGAALAFVGCSQSDDKKGIEDGLCTAETVSAYNSINTYYYINSKGDISGHCSKLKSLIGGKSCKAENVSSGNEMTISFQDVKSKCEPESVDTKASTDKTSRPTDEKPVAPLDPAMDKQGNCSKAVVSANNSILESALRLQRSQFRGKDFALEVRHLISNCDKLTDLLQGRSCKAISSDGYSAVTIKEAPFEKLCTSARETDLTSN